MYYVWAATWAIVSPRRTCPPSSFSQEGAAGSPAWYTRIRAWAIIPMGICMISCSIFVIDIIVSSFFSSFALFCD
jgi:hypothetical protein